MSKEYEKARLRVKKDYEDKLLELDRLKKIELKYHQLEIENDELKQENEQLKDWVDRLLEYCNLTEDDMKILQDDLRISKYLESLTDIMNSFRSRF